MNKLLIVGIGAVSSAILVSYTLVSAAPQPKTQPEPGIVKSFQVGPVHGLVGAEELQPTMSIDEMDKAGIVLDK